LRLLLSQKKNIIVLNKSYNIYNYIVNMKLKQYFEDISKQKLSEEEKMKIYENFLHKIEAKSNLARFSFYLKVWVFTLFFVIILYILIPFVFVDKNNKQISINKSVYTGLYIKEKENKSNKSFNKVYANVIWKILDLKGD